MELLNKIAYNYSNEQNFFVLSLVCLNTLINMNVFEHLSLSGRPLGIKFQAELPHVHQALHSSKSNNFKFTSL